MIKKIIHSIMRSKKKISLSFYNSSQFSDESDLNILLDESTYER